LVDQADDFVLSKIDLAVGARTHSIQAPVAYEVPPEVIREAIELTTEATTLNE
jgi:hypothetical protein